LAGLPAGRWSVWVSGNWRLVFAFDGENAVAVDYVDYHYEGAMGRMYNPPHPGETIREDILPALGLSVTEAARDLGVSRVALSRILHGKASISPAMARRLQSWLNGPEHGPSAESWLRGQLAYDLWRAEQAPRPQVQPVARWDASAIQPIRPADGAPRRKRHVRDA
jgi:addiction module HigA family antidote